jgi:hypothetical protein
LAQGPARRVTIGTAVCESVEHRPARSGIVLSAGLLSQ